MAESNVRTFRTRIDAQTPLIGIEPSGILSFRDEYPRLVGSHLRKDAQQLFVACKTGQDENGLPVLKLVRINGNDPGVEADTSDEK